MQISEYNISVIRSMLSDEDCDLSQWLHEAITDYVISNPISTIEHTPNAARWVPRLDDDGIVSEVLTMAQKADFSDPKVVEAFLYMFTSNDAVHYNSYGTVANRVNQAARVFLNESFRKTDADGREGFINSLRGAKRILCQVPMAEVFIDLLTSDQVHKILDFLLELPPRSIDLLETNWNAWRLLIKSPKSALLSMYVMEKRWKASTRKDSNMYKIAAVGAAHVKRTKYQRPFLEVLNKLFSEKSRDITCFNCGRTFKSRGGLATHKHKCGGSIDMVDPWTTLEIHPVTGKSLFA